MLNKELIIEKCKENGACINEFTMLVNSKNDKAFSEVLLDNLGWLESKDLIQYIDSKELSKYVGTNNKWIYNFCKYIKDRKKLWTNLTEDYWIFLYCECVKDRKELWPNLTEDIWIYYYLQDIKDRPELRIKLQKQN